MSDMGCERWQDAISARADGEDPGIEARLLAAHLDRCPECRAFEAAVDGTRRRLSVEPAAPMPDLSRRVAKTNALLDRAGKWSLLRAMLIVVAVEIIVAAVPALVLGDGEANAHEARHLGAFSVAYAVALLVAAVRPARARTVLPVASVLAGALFVTAVVDLANGTVPLINEASHLPELISVVLVWMLAAPAPSTATTVGRRNPLRVVRAREERRAM